MQPPNQPMQPPMGGAVPSATASDAVNIPAIGLLVIAALAALYSLFNLFGGGQMIAAWLAHYPGLPPELQESLRAAQQGGSHLGERIYAGVMLLVNGLIIYGALQMRNLKTWGLGITAAILVMIPCFTSCCCLPGLGVGIWALVVLNKPEVKSAFS